jgi:hypothetical protein
MPPRIAIFLAVGTAALSVGQAWAMDSERARLLRHLIVWIFTSFLLTRLARWVFEWRAEDVQSGPMPPTLAVLAAFITAIALGIGAYRERARVDAWGDRVRRLSGVHFAVLFFGGAIGLLIVVVVGLSQVH